MRRLLVAAACVAACLPTSAALASPATLATPTAPRPAAPVTADDAAFAAYPVEDFATYDPQKTCRKKPLVGTVELGTYLVATYGGGGGAVNRPCSDPGTSEHKDGRAVDWTLDATDPADRALAEEFLTDAFASDAIGDADALARRMGIMYVIWNDQMYAAYRDFQPTPYLSPSCRSKRKCSPTLRHRDHLHISLSKAGAKALTSFYLVTNPS